MNHSFDTEEIRVSQHLYSYLSLLIIAGFAFFLIALQSNVLREFRTWISPETLDANLLVWFALFCIMAVISFFLGIIFQMYSRRYRITYMFGYLMIFSVTLLFVTIFYSLWWSPAENFFMAKLGILILGNFMVAFFAAIFYYLNFESWYNFWVFTIGIMAGTSAFNWLYLSTLDTVARF